MNYQDNTLKMETSDLINTSNSKQIKMSKKSKADSLSYVAIKRVIDIAGSLVGIVLLSPIFLTTAAAIAIEDNGPIIYKQKRIGKDEKIFWMYKFRSMYKNADKIHNALKEEYQSEEISFKLKDDPRITRVGKIIRRLSIDELPQLINILKGEMSIVGPRPLPDYEYEDIKGKYTERYKVPQGLTCYWQVSGRSNIDFEKRMEMDKQYAKDANLLLDIKLILKTIWTVLCGDGAY